MAVQLTDLLESGDLLVIKLGGATADDLVQTKETVVSLLSGGTLASIKVGGATADKELTTKDYVDTALALKRALTNLRFGGDTHYSEFEADGHLVFNGNATAWEDVNLDPTSMAGGGTAPTSISFSTSTVKIASFVNAATDEVCGMHELPHAWKLGSQISFHCHWCPTTTNTGTCRFGLEYFFIRAGQAPSFPVKIYAEQAGGGVAWAKQDIAFANITPVSELGVQLAFRFFRDGSHVNDTFTGDAAVSTIGFHYEMDGTGSRQIGTK